jgi:putative permease
VTEAQVSELIGAIRAETVMFGQRVLSWSLASVVGIITILVYLILMPLLVFFFMKDKELIVSWFRRFLPSIARS